MNAKEQAERKAKWLEALAEHVTVAGACRATGVGRRTIYDWRSADEAFAAAMADIDADNVEQAEAVLYEMAVTGTERVKLDKEGDVVERWTERDPQLLQFLLKARRPEVYRDRMNVQHSGDANNPVRVQGTPDLSKLSREQLTQLDALLAQADAASDA